MILSHALALAVLAADPAAGNTMKDLLKDAVVAPAGGDDAGVPGLQNGLDISRMRFGADSVKQIVKSYQPQIQGCYEEMLATLKPKQKAPEGGLKTHFIITGEGLVKGAKVDKKGSSLKDGRVHDCVVAVLSTMTFPKPPDGKDQPIEFPFNLKAVQ